MPHAGCWQDLTMHTVGKSSICIFVACFVSYAEIGLLSVENFQAVCRSRFPCDLKVSSLQLLFVLWTYLHFLSVLHNNWYNCTSPGEYLALAEHADSMACLIFFVIYLQSIKINVCW